MKKLYIIGIIILLSQSIFAQKVIIEENADNFADNGTYGPNLKKYTYFFMGGGFLAGSMEKGAEIMLPASFYYEMGVRHKRKITNFLSWGIAINNRYDFYRLKQNSDKLLPDTVQHDKEGLYFYKLGLEPFLRINFDKRRGNYLGHYLDLGARGDWNWLLVNYYKDKNDGLKTTANRSGFDFYEAFNYSAFARIGMNTVDITATYRLSSLFKSDRNLPELPEYAIGINFSIVYY